MWLGTLLQAAPLRTQAWGIWRLMVIHTGAHTVSNALLEGVLQRGFYHFCSRLRAREAVDRSVDRSVDCAVDLRDAPAGLCALVEGIPLLPLGKLFISGTTCKGSLKSSQCFPVPIRSIRV